MNTVTEPRTVAVFTYGTLRPGQALARVIRPAVVDGAEPLTATVQGFRLHANDSRTYPYLVPTDLPGGAPVTGTLYLVHEEHRGFQQTRSIELGAGYEERVVTATLPDGRTMEALAWVYTRTRGVGDLITSGDWCEWSQHNFPDWSGGWSE